MELTTGRVSLANDRHTQAMKRIPDRKGMQLGLWFATGRF